MIRAQENSLHGRGSGFHGTAAAIARWLAAVIAIFYGFAKLNGAQFTVIDSELTRPMGDVSGFWLTWYFFSYSPYYGTFIALVQVSGGVLLTLPRTSLLGALLLFPVAVNILLVDLFYGIGGEGTLAAVVLLTCLFGVVAPHARSLLQSIILDGAGRLSWPLRTLVLGLILAAAWGFTFWAANYNNRFPTPIDGTWDVIAKPGSRTARPQKIFFERNRAHLVVFRSESRPDARHHFEVETDGTVRVWKSWLQKGPLIAQGRLESENRMILELLTTEGGSIALVRK
ncbi:MAG: hypothetical protein AAF690_28105 [Acidobacteriota bacterium]